VKDSDIVNGVHRRPSEDNSNEARAVNVSSKGGQNQGIVVGNGIQEF